MGSAPEHSNKVTISKEVTQMWGSPTARKGYAYTIVSCVQQHSVFKKQWWSSPKLCPTLATPWTVAHQAPQSMEFSRQGYWSGLPFPSSGDPPDPGIKPPSPALQADSLPLSHWGSANQTSNCNYYSRHCHF